MKYNVTLHESEEGFAASVIGLPGCHSQGSTQQEAIDNITDAIREYLDAARELASSNGNRAVVIEVE